MRRGTYRHHELPLQPLLRGLICKQEPVAHGDSCAPLNVLLGASFVLVPHVHNCGSLTTISFGAEETLEVFLDQSGHTAHRALLTRAILAIARALTRLAL